MYRAHIITFIAFWQSPESAFDHIDVATSVKTFQRFSTLVCFDTNDYSYGMLFTAHRGVGQNAIIAKT